ncbi:hypothetical protein REB14_23995, partial [Chryseobacterium sp. ES2]
LYGLTSILFEFLKRLKSFEHLSSKLICKYFDSDLGSIILLNTLLTILAKSSLPGFLYPLSSNSFDMIDSVASKSFNVN